MLVDETKIKIKAGNGGDGNASFRREKHVPMGGPDGGDGGAGGDIIFQVNHNLDTLFDYARKKHWQAENGENGKNKNMYGKNGEDLILKVPKGTIIYESVKLKAQSAKQQHKAQSEKKEKIADLTEENQSIIICKGGKGGLGNMHFKSAINQAPREFTPGKAGEDKTLMLELRMIADVGLIGLPNAGKSTLISTISNARPKIANYPFTTIEPNLGMVDYKGKRFVVADIPGLISGASEGKGLGHKFLRHIKRTKILVHLIDINSADLVGDYKTIRTELKEFDKELLKKKEIILLTKIDTKTEKDCEKIKNEFSAKIKNKNIMIISSVSRKNINILMDLIVKIL